MTYREMIQCWIPFGTPLYEFMAVVQTSAFLQLIRYSDWATDWTTGFRSPAEQRYFSLRHPVQTGCGAHTSSYEVCSGGCFPGGDADHSPPSSPEVRNTWSYTSTPPYSSWCLSRQYVFMAMLGGPLDTTAWRVLRLRMEGSPPGTEGSCKCIE
jgi:hypothetical protein